MGKRRQSRELVLKFLYEYDLNRNDLGDQFIQFRKRNPASEKVLEFVSRLIFKTVEHQQEIDDRIQKSCENWSLSRMAVVDRNILRMAVAELYYLNTPARVAIDEAVEIAKKFGGTQSPEFINGILDRVNKDSVNVLPFS